MPLVFAVLFWGGELGFFLLVWIGFTIGNREVLHLLYQKPGGGEVLFHWLIGTLALGGAYWKGPPGFFLALTLGAVLGMVRWITAFENHHRFFEFIGKQLVALWYLPLFLPFFILIRSDPEGMTWVFFLLAVNYAGDTGAYYVGRGLGRHKLAARVSPQKTIEGSLGGLAANALVAWGFQEIFLFQHQPLALIFLGLVIGLVSQVGDLVESVLKRIARVKDSSSIFPGHGGFLDRVDSLLLPAPLVYGFMIFLR
jgi:phosphatidate cytidylyltransferase